MPAASNVVRGSSRQFQAAFEEVITFEATVDPAASAADTGQTIQLTGVTGAALGDVVLAACPFDPQDNIWVCGVSAADTVELQMWYTGTGTPNLASATWKFVVLRPSW